MKKEKLKRIKPANYFFLCSGKTIKNLKELAKELKNMPEEIFNNHVDEGKNDFANWLIYVLEKKKLGQELTKYKEKDKIELLLLRELYY